MRAACEEPAKAMRTIISALRKNRFDNTSSLSYSILSKKRSALDRKSIKARIQGIKNTRTMMNVNMSGMRDEVQFTLPPVDLRAVCLVRAIRLFLWLFLGPADSVWFERSNKLCFTRLQIVHFGFCSIFNIV